MNIKPLSLPGRYLFHILIVLSSLQLANKSPVLLKLIHHTVDVWDTVYGGRWGLGWSLGGCLGV